MKRLLTWIRVLISIGLLVFLVRQLKLGDLYGAAMQAGMRWPWLVSGVVMTGLGLVAGAIRWQRILTVQGLAFPLTKTVRIFFVGQFFNAFMLGACGGDVVRAYYAAKGQEGRRTEAAMTILMDRAIGLFSVILFCCMMIPARISVFLDHEGPRDTGFLMVLFLIGSVVGLFALFRKHAFEHIPFFQRIENTTRIGPLIRRSYDAFFLCKRHPRLLLTSLVLSLLSMAFQTLACWNFGRGLELKTPIIDYFALFPIISVLMSVPITPGSLGVREGLFVSMFGAVLVGKPQALLMSLLFYAGGTFWSLVGGLLYLGLGSKPEHGFAASSVAAVGAEGDGRSAS